MPVLIGTSGWQYRDWRGGLYPAGVAQRRWLEHYASYYLTVENNASFYRLPAGQTFAGWRARTPGDFVMAVKASRYLTHVRRLRDPEEPVARLSVPRRPWAPSSARSCSSCRRTLKAEPALLDACLTEFRRAALPGHGPLRIAVEPRHSSWWTEEVRQILAAHGAALCWADRLGRAVTPLWRTARWGYLRFHEGTAEPWPCYTDRDLRSGPSGCGRRGRPTRTCTSISTMTPAGPPWSTRQRSRRWPVTPASWSPGRPGRRCAADPGHPDVVSGSRRACA